MAVYGTEIKVRSLTPDFRILADLNNTGAIATAPFLLAYLVVSLLLLSAIEVRGAWYRTTSPLGMASAPRPIKAPSPAPTSTENTADLAEGSSLGPKAAPIGVTSRNGKVVRDQRHLEFPAGVSYFSPVLSGPGTTMLGMVADAQVRRLMKLRKQKRTLAAAVSF